MVKNKKHKDKNANKQEQQIMESVDDNLDGKYFNCKIYKINFNRLNS